MAGAGRPWWGCFEPHARRTTILVQLVQEIKQVLDVPLVKGQPPQVINDVLFTAFILR